MSFRFEADVINGFRIHNKKGFSEDCLVAINEVTGRLVPWQQGMEIIGILKAMGNQGDAEVIVHRLPGYELVLKFPWDRTK